MKWKFLSKIGFFLILYILIVFVIYPLVFGGSRIGSEQYWIWVGDYMPPDMYYFFGFLILLTVVFCFVIKYLKDQEK